MLLVAAVCSGLVCQTSVAFQDNKEKTEKKTNEKDDDKKDEKESLQDRMNEVQSLLRNGEQEDALDLLQAIYDDGQEDNPRIAVSLIGLMQRVGIQRAQEDRKSGNELFYESAKIARKHLKDGGLPAQAKVRMASVIYNEACTYAIDGKNEEALASLKESFEMGFDDFELASTDSDFGDLLKSDEFKKIIEDRKKYLAQKKIDDLNKSIDDFKPYDFDYELEDVEGKTVKKLDSKGKMLIVDIWGTWCGPCRREIPSFVKLKEKYGDKLDIVGIAYERTEDDEEALENVKEFMKEYDVNYACALGTDEVKKQVRKLRGYPTTLFIDRTGTVRMQLVGFRTYDVLEMTLEAVMDKKDSEK